MSKKVKKQGLKDPYRDREAAKYDRPIPSRELILQLLNDSAGPMRFDELCETLQLSDAVDLEALDRRLRAMQRDGQLVRNRVGAFLPVSEKGLIHGRVIAHPDGFGFLAPDEGGDDVFLSPRQMNRLFHGDRAVVRVMGIDHRGRAEGAVVEVLERNTRQVVGRFCEERGMTFVAPDNKRIPLNVMIPPQDRSGACPGQIVLAAIVEQPSKHSPPIGRIVEVLGEHMDPGMEIDIALRSYELPHKWPDDVLAEAQRLGDRVAEKAKHERVDLRSVPLVTIDGEDAKDFDDAVYCEPDGEGGWKLLVAIADVSHYVPADDALDMEAKRRGTSVYFPGQVVPMLPEALSNGLCSLNPHVDRLTLVADMSISKGGALKKFDFYEGVIRSAARLTYNRVATMLAGEEGSEDGKYAELMPHLHNLYGLYKTLNKARQRRGAIDFDTQETRIVFGEARKIERIVPVQRNDAHRLIEECMIMANVAAARFLSKHKMPALYRIHQGPKQDKLDDLKTFLAGVGLELNYGDGDPRPKDFALVLKKAGKRHDAQLIQSILLRSLQQAVYSPDNEGHFGLALSAYAHFTSPIRRYPDLLVHRAIRHVIHNKAVRQFHYNHHDMAVLGEQCSMSERRADDAVRDVVDWLKCEFMLDKVGQVFEGLVSTVTGFGVFVQLKDVYVEGLVHVTALSNDYYRFDPVSQSLHGEHGGRVYRVGDLMSVRVARVDLDERKIDFVPEEVTGESGRKKGKSSSRSKRRRKQRRGPG